MSEKTPGFLIDSDVLITAKNSYYAFSICPGFWDSLLHEHARENIYSIDRVKQELLSGHDDDEIVQWVRRSVPSKFFLKSTAKVSEEFQSIMQWAMGHPRYQDAAKTKFATSADGWLVAHGMVTGRIVVTNETPRPDASNQIKLPDVCAKFGVQCVNSFAMLKQLRIKYHFSPSPI